MHTNNKPGDPHKKHKLSVQVLTQNSERLLEKTLDSISWADEIQVIDGGSSDSTLKICSRYDNLKVLHHPYENYGAQHNWGLPQLCNDWVLIIDSDEWLSFELQEEIKGILACEQPSHDGYVLMRRSYFLGRLIRYSGWQRDKELRLFRRSKGRLKDQQVHSSVTMSDGTVGRLNGFLYHDPYSSLDDYLNKMQRYTSWGANEFIKTGKRFKPWMVLLNPLGRFLRSYVLYQGFRDGLHGLILCLLSMYYVMVKYAKVWIMQKNNGSK